MNLDEKYNVLKEYLRSLNKVAIAYSSGVDSTLLLKVAKDVLNENVIAITATSSVFTNSEKEETINFCKQYNIPHYFVEVDTLNVYGFKENSKDRCYYCKKEIFNNIIKEANKHDYFNILEGSNMDDLNDYRPGMKAIKELDIKSPLRVAKLNKEEIRLLSKQLNLPTFNKPSFACLASRFVYGETITVPKLKMVEKGEECLKGLGFKQYRVRMHGDTLARIEVFDEDIDLIIKNKQYIINTFKNIGFTYITLDLIGYRTGSMNEVLSEEDMK